MNTGSYAAIILAAGLSNRMKDFKPLLLVGGETITDRVISTFLSNDLDIILVTGWQRNELISGIKHRDITIADNPDYELGMFSSVRTGVRHLLTYHRAFFVMPVDIPLVRPTTIKLLLDTAKRHPGEIIYPVFDYDRGHPPLIPYSLVPEILSCQKDGNLKTILNLHREISMEVNVPDENILLDVDTREDFVALLKRFQQYDIPTHRECEAIMNISGIEDDTRRHCRKVAEVAVVIAEALVKAGSSVDINKVRAAAILHDIAKGHQKTGVTGDRILRDSGFNMIGDIIAAYNNLSSDNTLITLETRIVYLADKFVLGEEVVSIEERYHLTEEKHGKLSEAAENMQKCKTYALRVKEELETILGYSLESIVF